MLFDKHYFKIRAWQIVVIPQSLCFPAQTPISQVDNFPFENCKDCKSHQFCL